MEVDNAMEEAIGNENQNSNSTQESNELVSESGTPVEDYTDLWLQFKCVFCEQDLKSISQPKLLPCLHTACDSCLNSESNVETTGASSTASGWSKRGGKKLKTGRNKCVIRNPSRAGPKQLQCPICTQEVLLHEVVDHLFLTEYAENSESLPEEFSFPCTSCDEGADGSAFCMECQEWLCDSCVSAHHRVRVTKDHTVRSKEDMQDDIVAGKNQKYLFCPTHTHEQLKLYCESCDKLTCRDCQLSDHKDHKYQFLSNACEEEKGHIAELLTKIKEKQGHIENASGILNKRNEEILEREKELTEQIKTFAITFITLINKRAKTLLEDLNKVCTDKKSNLHLKNQDLHSISERLKHSQKFAEAAITLGSETALVYSKKPIMNQLKRILRHRCELPQTSQSVDIQFSYESNFLTSYIGTMGQLLVNQQPIPGAANIQNMLPMPVTQSPTIVRPTPPQPRPQPIVNMNQYMPRPDMAQHRLPSTVQTPQQPLGQQLVPFNQAQVTSSTDLARNIQHQQQMRQVAKTYNNRNVNMMPQQQQQRVQQPSSFNNQQFRDPTRQVTMRQVVPQQQQRQVVQQSPTQHPQQQQTFNSVPIKNANISLTPVPSSSGPSPNKQRALAPRGLSMTPINNNNNAQRANQATPPRGGSQPQLIVLDDQPNQKTPNMSNTSRLSHFPTHIAASLATAHPSLQIQPVTNNFNNANIPLTNQQVLALLQQMKLNEVTVQDLQVPTSVRTQLQVSPAANIASKPVSPLFQVPSQPPPSYAATHPQQLTIVAAPATQMPPSVLKTALTAPPTTPDVVATAASPLLKDLLTSVSLQTESVGAISGEDGGFSQLADDTQVTAQEEEEQGASVLTRSPEAVPTMLKSRHSSSSSEESLPSLDALLSCAVLPPPAALPTPAAHDPNEDFCAVCRDGGEVVCCNTCPRVYHYACHVPPLSVKKMQENVLLCGMCTDVTHDDSEPSKRKLIGLQGRELSLCEKVLLETLCHPNSVPFQERVDKKVPNYYKIIKRPIELSTIRMKLSPTHFEHYDSIMHFLDDVILLFQNCYTYNTVNTHLHVTAKTIEGFFRELLKQYLPDFVSYFSEEKLSKNQ